MHHLSVRYLHLENLESRRLLTADGLREYDIAAEPDLVASVQDAISTTVESEAPDEDATYDLGSFRDRLSDSGIRFFGAHWCSRCQTQKELFGDAAARLPYVEVANRDGTPNRIAITESIDSFPTWRIPKQHVEVNTALIAHGLGIPPTKIEIADDSVDVQAVLAPEQLSWLTGIEIPLDDEVHDQTTDGLSAALVDAVMASGESVSNEKRNDVSKVDNEVIKLSDPIPDAKQLVSDLDTAGVRLFITPGDFYADMQTDLFGRVAQSLPVQRIADREGHRTPAAIEAGITHGPTWVFPGPIDIEAVRAASSEIGRDFHSDQWTISPGRTRYLGILQPTELAAAAGITLPMTTLQRAIETTAPEASVTLAKQLTDSGAVFYGDDQCPHCQSQKAEFGAAALMLPYVESLNDDGTLTQEATEAGIRMFPTWRFIGTPDLAAIRAASEGESFDESRVTIHDGGFDIIGSLQSSQLAAAIGVVSQDRLSSLTVASGEPFDLPGAWRNPFGTFDVNDDGRTSALDALQVINRLNVNDGNVPIAGDGSIGDYQDVSGDGNISALDALQIINELNRVETRTPFIASVSTDTVFRFAGESVTWQHGFGDSGVSFRVDISSRVDCRGDILRTQIVTGDSVELASGLDVGTFYACVRMQTDDGIVRSARPMEAASAPIQIGQAFDVAASHRVFVSGTSFGISSSTRRVGSEFGNNDGADWNCTNSAAVVGLVPNWDFNSIVWKAVISDSDETAYDRLKIDGPLLNMQGELLATDKDDFFDNRLLTPIRYDERGTEGAEPRFWHGTSNNGRITVENCEDWNPAGGPAEVGSSESVFWLGGGTGGGDCGTDVEGLACVSPLQAPID